MKTPTAPASPAPLHCHRGFSPWSGYTSSAAEEEAGRTVSTQETLSGLEAPAHLNEWRTQKGPLLAIDRKNRRVVVSAQAFQTAVKRAELTRLPAGKRHLITQLKDLSLAQDALSLSRFLILSELILTYAHLESHLQFVGQSQDRGESVWTEWKGTHEYFTNEHHVQPLHFRIEINTRSGEIVVVNL